MDDHEQLLSLMPDSSGAPRSVEACKRCRGYLKSLTVLSAGEPLHVLVDDLACVDLDIVAIDQDCRRPGGPGYKVDCTVAYAARAQHVFSRKH